jgi:hypothetical protein
MFRSFLLSLGHAPPHSAPVASPVSAPHEAQAK